MPGPTNLKNKAVKNAICLCVYRESREKERAAELEMKAKLFSFEQHKPEDQVRYLSFVVLLCQVLCNLY